MRKLPLLAVLILIAGLAVTGCAVVGEAVDTTGKVDFRNPLSVPPLATSRVDEQGQRVFDLRAQPGARDFGRGGTTATWGFNSDYLGPTLRAKRGERVLVNVTNGLNEDTTVHWHGMHLPAVMDGGPHQTVAAGTIWSPTWTINQPAATLWYHPHLHGETEVHVYRGLAGMFILDDDASAGLPLPSRYGVDDFPVIVQDRNFTDRGQFHFERGQGGIGILGDTLLVNGTVAPYLDVTTERVRLRLLNASSARSYDFGLADDRTFALIGTDGGLLPAPHPTARIRLSPGERAEVVVTVRPGERLNLRSFPPRLGGGFIADRMNGAEDTFDVLQLRAAATLQPAPQLPAALAPIERMDAASASATRTFRMAGHTVNGRKMDMDRIDATITKGATEIWQITGQDGMPHNFHIHGVQFQVLDVGGQHPPPELRGWKDTVFIHGNETVRVIVQFPDYTDPVAPYMFHCHLLFHEDQGMMGQFVVVEHGQQPVQPQPQPGHSHR